MFDINDPRGVYSPKKKQDVASVCEYGHDWDEGQYGIKKCKTCRRYKI